MSMDVPQLAPGGGADIRVVVRSLAAPRAQGQFRVIVNGRLVVTAQASTLGPGDLYAFVDSGGRAPPGRRW